MRSGFEFDMARFWGEREGGGGRLEWNGVCLLDLLPFVKLRWR